jgi:hypothetical protein
MFMNFLNKNCTELNTQTPILEEEVASDSASISYKTFEQSVPWYYYTAYTKKFMTFTKELQK